MAVQYITSRNLSWIAIGIALISLIYGCVSSHNTDKLYKQQLQKQDEIIQILKQVQAQNITQKTTNTKSK